MKFEDKEDDAEVFLKLLSEHERDIRVYVIAMVGKVSDAEEILQDSRLAMWKNFKQFELGSNFKAWGAKGCVSSYSRVSNESFSRGQKG